MIRISSDLSESGDNRFGQHESFAATNTIDNSDCIVYRRHFAIQHHRKSLPPIVHI